MTHKEKIKVQFVHHRRGCMITWPPALFIKSQRGNKGLSQSRSLNEIKELYFLWLFNCNAGNSSHNQDISIAFTAFKLELFYNSICQQEQLSAPLLLLQLCSYLPFSFLAFCLVQTNSRPHLCWYFKAVLFSLSPYVVVLSSFSCITEMPVQRRGIPVSSTWRPPLFKRRSCSIAQRRKENRAAHVIRAKAGERWLRPLGLTRHRWFHWLLHDHR